MQRDKMVTEPKWNTERPKESGYYLATWKYGRNSLRVSEFWFDGTLWWSGREYVGDGTYSEPQRWMDNLVVAWMPKPKPYRKK